MTPLRTLLSGAVLALAATAATAHADPVGPPLLCVSTPESSPVVCVTNPPLCVHTYAPLVPVTRCPASS